MNARGLGANRMFEDWINSDYFNIRLEDTERGAGWGNWEFGMLNVECGVMRGAG